MPSAEAARLAHELFETYHAPVLAYAMRRALTHGDAEDAASETFLIAWRRLDDLPADPLPWLYGTCRRVLANQRRSGRRRMALRLRLVEPEPPQVQRFGEEQGAAMTALMRLRPGDQELLRLVAWEELSHEQVAASLGISVNAMTIRLHRARRRFAEQLASADVKGSGADRTSGRVKGMPPDGRQEDAG